MAKRRPGKRGPEEPVLDAIATTADGRDISRGFVDQLDYLAPQDPILRQRCRGDWEVYEELLRDDQVKPTFEQRRMAVVAHEWFVEAASEEPADVEAGDWIRELLKSLRFDNLTKKMLSAVFFGYAVAECLWGVDGERVTLQDVRVRKQRRFRFSPRGELLLLTSKNPRGELMPGRKFWVVACGADDDDEPYGRGLAHYLYWPVFFKRNGLRYWSTFLDKFGDPTVVGTYQQGASQEDQAKLLKLVRAVRNDTGLIMPEGMKVALLESARAAGGDFGAFCDRMDAAISKIVLGQTMTTDDGSSLSQSQTHLSVRDQLIKADADLLCESFNRTVIRWLCEWNFPSATPPKVWRRFELPEDLAKRSQRDVAISQLGYRPTLDEVREVYGGEWEPMPQPAALPASPFGSRGEGELELAEPDRQPARPDGAQNLVDQLGDKTELVLDRLGDEVRTIVESAGSLEEIRDRLFELNPGESVAEMAEIVRDALVAGELLGRAEVAAEVVDGIR